MNRFVSKYSSSPLSLPQEENFGQLCGRWDAAQQLAFPSFDIPAIHNVRKDFSKHIHSDDRVNNMLYSLSIF